MAMDVQKPTGARRAELLTIGRFVLVGGVGAVIYIVGTLAMTALGVPPVVASVLSQLIGGLLFFFGHGFVTFGVDPRRVRTVWRFLVFAVGSLAINGFATAFLLHGLHLPSLVVIGILTLLVPTANYVISRLWVFA